MKKGHRQVAINTIVAFVVMPIFGARTKEFGNKRFDVSFGEENPYRPKVTDAAQKAIDKAKKEADKYLDKLLKDANKKLISGQAPLTKDNFWIKEVRLKTSVSHKVHTRGEHLINIAEKKRSKRLTEKKAEASKV